MEQWNPHEEIRSPMESARWNSHDEIRTMERWNPQDGICTMEQPSGVLSWLGGFFFLFCGKANLVSVNNDNNKNFE